MHELAKIHLTGSQRVVLLCSSSSLWKQASPKNTGDINLIFTYSRTSLQKRLYHIAVQNCRWLELSGAPGFSPQLCYCKVQHTTPQMFRYSQFLSLYIKFKLIPCVLLNCLITLHYDKCTATIWKSQTVLLKILFQIGLH